MKRVGLDAFICGSPNDVLLLTGYWPVMGLSLAILTAEGEMQVVLPEDEVEIAVRSSEASRLPYKPASLSKLVRPIEAISNSLSSVISKLGLTKAAIGVRLHEVIEPASYVSCSSLQTSLLTLLRNLLPQSRFLGCDDVLEELKSRKTSAELRQLRNAVEIAASGFEIAPQAICEGRREAEVAAELQSAFESSLKAAEVQRSYGFFFCMSGSNSASASAAYARTRQRKIELGDLVMVHANTCADGYWTDITRTYTVGRPDKRQEAMRTAITEARTTALAAIRPGVTGAAVDSAARRVMAAHGFDDAFKHSTGHGVGFAAVNSFAVPRIHPHSFDVLDVGMTFNIEPAAYFDGYGGMRHCDVVAVAADNAHVLTNF